MRADSSNGAILAVEHLAKRFGGVVATDDVSLAIEDGALQCIIGPNGAGKSTFFALLCGIQQPDAGRILFAGREITRLLPFARVRLGLGLTFQTNRTFGELSVRQNLAVPMALRWAQRGPYSMASRTPLQDSGFTGGMKRFLPDVGPPYGMPLKTRMPSERTPRTWPLAVSAMTGPSFFSSRALWSRMSWTIRSLSTLSLATVASSSDGVELGCRLRR